MHSSSDYKFGRVQMNCTGRIEQVVVEFSGIEIAVRNIMLGKHRTYVLTVQANAL